MTFLRALFDDLLGLSVAEWEPDRPDPLQGEPGERPYLGDSAARCEGLKKEDNRLKSLIKNFKKPPYSSTYLDSLDVFKGRFYDPLIFGQHRRHLVLVLFLWHLNTKLSHSENMKFRRERPLRHFFTLEN